MPQRAAAAAAASVSTVEPLAAAVQRVSLARGVGLSVAWRSVLQALQGGAAVAFADGSRAASASAWQVVDVGTPLVDLARPRIGLENFARFAPQPGAVARPSGATWRDLVGRDAVIAWLVDEVGNGTKPADFTRNLARCIGLQRQVVEALAGMPDDDGKNKDVAPILWPLWPTTSDGEGNGDLYELWKDLGGESGGAGVKMARHYDCTERTIQKRVAPFRAANEPATKGARAAKGKRRTSGAKSTGSALQKVWPVPAAK